MVVKSEPNCGALNGFTSPPARIRFFVARQSRLLLADFKSAIAPVTCGVAIEVPESTP